MLNPDFVYVLVKGVKGDGQDFWAYVGMTPEKFLAFKQVEKDGSYNLADFGSIVKHGSGTEPPAEIVRFMRENYNFDETLENSLEKYRKSLSSDTVQ